MVDDGFFIDMSTVIRQGKLNTKEDVIKYSKSVAQKIGSSKFFIPPFIRNNSFKARNMLGSYISADNSAIDPTGGLTLEISKITHEFINNLNSGVSDGTPGGAAAQAFFTDYYENDSYRNNF